jgi:diguanylate cyclase (GGDEF)-like protein
MSWNFSLDVWNSGLGRRSFRACVLVALLPAVLVGAWHWDRAAEQASEFETQRLMILAQERAGELAVSAGAVPERFGSDLRGGYAVVLDRQGRVLFENARVPEQLLALFVREAKTFATAPGRTQVVSWNADAREWRGAMVAVPDAQRVAARLRGALVVVFTDTPSAVAQLRELLPQFSVLLAVAILAAWLAAAGLLHRYRRGIEHLRAGLHGIVEGEHSQADADGSDEIGDLERELSAAQSALAHRERAVVARAAMDEALLGTHELDQGIERALGPLRIVTQSHAVGVVLVDTATGAHGRLLLAIESSESVPVQRVTLDPEMAAALGACGDTMTIARTELPRHAFLTAFTTRAANTFWLWPIVHQGVLAAVLVVAYQNEPQRDPEAAAAGHWLAERLRLMLSRSARDEALYRQAHFDALTQLPNRALFRDRLSQELAAAAAGLARGALLYIDLDHFKKVNDTLGHAAGDQLLAIVAQRLKACVKDGDTVARLGGDEFSVVLRHVGDPDSARTVAERIVCSLQLPVNVAGRDHHVRASVGISMFPDDGATLEEVLRSADLAMYRAKENGRGQAVFYERDMNVRPILYSDTGLHRALKRRELSLFYQPQFRIADGQLAGCEALLRWQTRYDGMKLPSEFIPSAEQTGLIVDIGGWVLDAACQQLAVWRDAGLPLVPIAVNVSAQQLVGGQFVDSVGRALMQYRLPAALLEIELIESVLAEEEAERSLRELAALGVGVAVDDFGTGFSSLNYLRRYPIGTVKLDRSFLEEVPRNSSATVVAESVITMAHSLGKRVVAEGVETLEQLEFLRQRRCAVAQGFFLARPMSSAAMTELLESRRMPADADSQRAAG